MTLISVAQAARRLGIDAKTLHRWLAEAQLPLQRHPHDGRQHALSEEHLQVLARLHQRRLAPLSEEEPAASAGAGLELPAALLALPEQLEAVQSQLAALHQQVAALTRLIEQHVPSPGSPAAQAQPSRTNKRPATPAAPRARPAASSAAKLSRKPVHVIPRVEYASEGRYVVMCPKQGLLALEPDSAAWFAWLAQQDSFRFVGQAGYFTAHHEWRVPRGAWRAHRHIRNRVYSLRLAPNQELTMAVLEQAAATIQAHLK